MRAVSGGCVAVVRYVRDRDGLALLKDFFRRGGPNDTSQTVRQTFMEVFGASLDSVEQDWLRFLDGQ